MLTMMKRDYFMMNLRDLILVQEIENKKLSKFAPKADRTRYIQHFPGGYKIESEVPAGTPVPFQAPPLSPFGAPFAVTPFQMPPYNPYSMSPYAGYPMTPYGGYPAHPLAHSYGYPPHHPYFGGYNHYDVSTQSYQQFMEFIDNRDKMKELLDKQTESLNSLKSELEGIKKGSYDFSEKVRHGEKQIIPITRSKR